MQDRGTRNQKAEICRQKMLSLVAVRDRFHSSCISTSFPLSEYKVTLRPSNFKASSISVFCSVVCDDGNSVLMLSAAWGPTGGGASSTINPGLFSKVEDSYTSVRHTTVYYLSMLLR